VKDVSPWAYPFVDDEPDEPRNVTPGRSAFVGAERAELLAWYEEQQERARERRGRALRVVPFRALYGVVAFLAILHLGSLAWLVSVGFGMSAAIALFNAFVANLEVHAPIEIPK
jgi:hypothetical protein